MRYLSFEVMPMILTVTDIADTLNISSNMAYELLSSGKIKAYRRGSHYRIPRESLISYIMKEINTD